MLCRQLLRLSRRSLGYLMTGLLLSGLVRLALGLLPFHAFLRLLGSYVDQGESIPVTPRAQECAADMALQISRIARFAPWQMRCLVQAATCAIMLRHSGIAYVLSIGMHLGKRRPGDDSSGFVAAHAWLEVGDRIILGACPPGRYVPVAAWSPLSNATRSGW